jgi:diguanylate cyclase
MPSIGTEGAEQFANTIREAVQARELVKRSTGETLGRVTMSLGVATFRAGDSSASLIERSDACLYTAKRSGRNRVVTEADAAPKAKAS